MKLRGIFKLIAATMLRKDGEPRYDTFTVVLL